AEAADHELHRRLPVAGAEVVAGGGGQGLDGLGADLGRPAPEPPVGGKQVGRDGDGGELRGHGPSVAARSRSGRSRRGPRRRIGLRSRGGAVARWTTARHRGPYAHLPGATMGSRLSDRIAAIAPSATLAVDAKAK